jgi:iron(III) transport system permease protein
MGMAAGSHLEGGVPTMPLPDERQAGPRPRPRPLSGGQGWLTAGTARTLLLAIGAYLVLPPLIYMIWSSLTPGGHFGLGGAFSTSAYVSLLRSRGLPGLLGSTGIFALGSAALGVGGGTAMAWLVERAGSPLRALAYAAAFVGFAVPGTLRVIGWLLLVNPQGGVINPWLAGLVGGWASGLSVENMGGMIFVEGFFWVPLAFLLMIGPLRAMDASLEEAASMAGARPWRTFRTVTARLLLPALLSVSLLCFIRVVQAFEVPLFIGVPAGVSVLTTQIYEGLQEAAIPDYSQASAYGVLMLVMLGAVLALYHRATRESHRYQTVGGKGFRVRRSASRLWQVVGGVYLSIMFIIEALPVAGIIVASFLPSLGGSRTAWTLSNYSGLFQFPGIVQSLTDSLIIALVTASAAVALAAASSWFSVRSPGRVGGLMDWLLGLPLVYPGVVMSLAVLIFYLRVPLPVYGTIWIMVLAYIPTFAPYAIRYVQPALLQIHRELEESAAVSGARPLALFRRILAPLLMPSLAGAWIFICLITIRELAVAALLYTAKSPVVATQLLDMWTNGNVNQLSAFGTIVTVLSIAIALPVYRFTRRFGFQA